MSKRTHTFKRRKQDRYFTPPEAVVPLLSHLGDVTSYSEPCHGEGHLSDALFGLSGLKCDWASDFDEETGEFDATKCNYLPILNGASHFITNSPWTRELLHPIIENLSNQLPTWLLFDADWKYTVQKSLAKRIGCKTVPQLLERCVKIVAVGRVSWMQNGTSSLDNCAWYLFDKNFTGQTEFYGRR